MSGYRQRPALNDPHDRYEKVTITQSVCQQAIVDTSPTTDLTHIGGQLASSSGGVSHTLRRINRPKRIDDGLRPILQAGQSLPAAQGATRFQDSSPVSDHPLSPPTSHPAVRVTRSTEIAVHFSLEEALRTPNQFTPDLAEERAQMSDLGARGNVRSSESTSRITGPENASGSAQAPIRTPREIMKDRNEREARRRAAAEQTERQQEEERRRSAERRAAATALGGAPTNSSSQRQSVSTSSQGIAQQSLPAAIRNTIADQPRPVGRPRGLARPVEESKASDTQPPGRQIPASSANKPISSTTATSNNSNLPRDQQRANAGQQRNNVSSFPHAFERWEQLSSHWEGLTSYWLHKLESNQDAIAKSVPTASAMSRQITDLSAAGANLFHAVVELQRLRASSERKFQRWFHETRAEQEKDRESRVELDRALQIERDAREELSHERERAEKDRKQAEVMVKEMRRELSISKEEARRAWEELGRREQEERDRTMSLKEGLPTVVGGVQVVPMHASPAVSRQGSQSQRPSTRGAGYASSHAASHDVYSQVAHDYYTGEGEGNRPSPTDTDPFTESEPSAPVAGTLHHEPDIANLPTWQRYEPYQRSTPATSGSVQTAIPPTSSRTATSQGVPASLSDIAADEPEKFYQQAGQSGQPQSEPRTDRSPVISQGRSAPTMAHVPQGPPNVDSEPAYNIPHGSADNRHYQSYSSEDVGQRGDGQFLPSQGREENQASMSVAARPGNPATTDTIAPAPMQSPVSEGSDKHGIAAGVERDQDELYSRTVPRTSTEAMAGLVAPSPPTALQSSPIPGYVYGPGGQVYEVGPGGQIISSSGPGTSAGPAAPQTTPVTSTVPQQGGGWETLQTRHHHPTRLSDVIEEEEGSARGSRVA